MATADEILSSLNDLVAGLSATLDAAGDSKLVTLNRATGADAALVKLREGGSERFRWGLPPGEDDFVIQYSPDGSPLSFADRFRIDGTTGLVTVTGLAVDEASFADTTFTGQSLFDPGSAAAPALAAVGDVDTGLFFPAADAIAGAVGGTEIWRTTAAGLAIGKAVADYPLDVEGDAAFSGNINLGMSAVIRSSSAFARGNVIISAPNYGLTRQVSYGNNLYIDDAGVYQQDTPIIGGSMLLMSALNGGFGDFAFVSKQDPDVGGAEYVRAKIDSSGRFIVGGTFGDYLLDVYGDIRARDRFLVGTGTGTAFGNDNLIKPASSSAFLNLKGGAGKAKVLIGNDDLWLVSGDNNIRFHVGAEATDGGSEVMRIDATGKVGIGTSAPATALHLKKSGGIFRLEDTSSGVAASPALQFYSADGLLAFFGLGSSSNNDVDLFTNAGNLDIWAGGLQHLRLSTTGQFLIGTTVTGASKLVVNDDSIQINNSKTPASASDTGTTGQIAWDASYLYVCTAPDTWTRAALATW
jgi:hypothetical protein